MRPALLIILAVWLGLASACEVEEGDLEGASCDPNLADSCGAVLRCDLRTGRCRWDDNTGGGRGGSGGGGGSR